MTRLLAAIAGVILGLVFAGLGLAFLLGFLPEPAPPPEGSAMWHFMQAMAPTGYMTFVKVLEVLGGALIAVPGLRRAGLLVLVPIVVNIAAFQVFIVGGTGILDPIVLTVCVLVGFLVWIERRAFDVLAPKRAHD